MTRGSLVVTQLRVMILEPLMNPSGSSMRYWPTAGWTVDQAHLEFQVRWMLGDIMWEPLAECKELEALDEYLELRGVQRPRDLPCKPDPPGRTRHMTN